MRRDGIFFISHLLPLVANRKRRLHMEFRRFVCACGNSCVYGHQLRIQFTLPLWPLPWWALQMVWGKCSPRNAQLVWISAHDEMNGALSWTLGGGSFYIFSSSPRGGGGVTALLFLARAANGFRGWLQKQQMGSGQPCTGNETQCTFTRGDPFKAVLIPPKNRRFLGQGK